MDMHLQASGRAADLDEDDHKALVFTLGKIGNDEWFGLPETDGSCSTDNVFKYVRGGSREALREMGSPSDRATPEESLGVCSRDCNSI